MKNIFKKGSVIDLYRIESDAVETGATATVWRVHHIEWDIDLAMKIPRGEVFSADDGKDDFIRECNLWIDLGLHPNIAPCYYVRDIEGIPAVFSEWSDLGSLADMIRSGKLYEGTDEECQRRIMETAIQILQGLEYANSHCIIHKDIKPANILINSQDEVKITDFGLANARTLRYTKPYYSPEQKNGGQLTFASDIYSWAVTVMEMYAGWRIWDDGVQAGKYCDDIFSKARVPVPDSMKKLLKNCLETDPKKRCSSTRLIRIDLVSAYNAMNFGSSCSYRFQNTGIKEIAGTLNNKALSYLDLNEPKKAVETWHEALRLNPNHYESLYNFYIYLWESGQMTDREILNRLSDFGMNNMTEYMEEIDRVRKCNYIRSFEGFDPGILEVDPDEGLTGVLNNVDAVYFSGDGKKILALNKADGKSIIWDADTGEKLKEYNAAELDKIPGSDWYCSESCRSGKRVLRLDEADDKIVGYSARLLDESMNRVIYTFSEFDAYPPFSFSPDGKTFVTNSYENILVLWSVPEESRCKPALSRVVTVRKMAEYESIFTELWNNALTAFNSKDYRETVRIVNEIEKIPYYGTSGMLVNLKKDLFRLGSPHIVRYDPKVIKIETFEGDIRGVILSPDDKYALIYKGMYSAYLWDFEANELVDILDPPEAYTEKYTFVEIYEMCFDSESEFICINYDDIYGQYAFHHIPSGKQYTAYDQIGKKVTWCDQRIKIPDMYTELCRGYQYNVISSSGSLLAHWFWQERLAIQELDYHLEYEPESVKDDNEYYVSEGEFFLSNKVRKEREKFIWLRENNKFLLELMSIRVYSDLSHLGNAEWAMIENPSIKFQRLAKAAQNHMKEHENDVPFPPHEDPEVQRLLVASDEEYERLLRECKRQSAFWRNERTCNVVTLILRTLEEYNYKKPREYVSEIDIPEIPHVKASLINRQQHLPELAKRIQNMRDTLLETVMGQDHVVHLFAEGMFNAEVLAAADENRRRPRAVFTFAGPPGVGKTFLAEQAAELLGLPCRRFDMTEYSGQYDHEGLIGIDYFWKSATTGKLTTFVKDNPKCLLIFDEIEKANIKVIQFFYQILDAGILTDKYIDTRKTAAEQGLIKDDEKAMTDLYKQDNPHVSFKDTVIIFTTNAGRSLYEGDSVQNAAAVTRNSLLNALSTEKDPQTNGAFFPTAIVSRIASGYPVLFNHLQPHNLVKIIENEYKRCGEMIFRQYGINVEADEQTVLSLLFAAGGKSDARSLTAQTGLFFKNELFKLLTLNPNALSDVEKIEFRAETEDLPDKIEKLFFEYDKPEILLYTNRFLAERCSDRLSGYKIHGVQNVEEALKIAAENDIGFALIDISQQSVNEFEAVGGFDDSDGKTVVASISANVWRDGKRLFSGLLEKFPELPIYILETDEEKIEAELLMSFIRAGARGMLAEPAEDFGDFEKQLSEISRQLYMQKMANDIAAEHKVLSFETAPKFAENKAVVSLRNFKLKRSAEADDINDLLSEADKPKERFSDVIGAASAKKELMFFVEFLKNPKKYFAQGHRLPKGILLHGKPGTGKTMLAKALAGEADVTFIPAAASAFVNRYAGSGPASVRELFKKARRYAPSIIFIDEVDTIAKQRTGRGSDEEDTLNALLAEMDGFAVDPKRPVFVLAATNYEVESGRGGIGVLDEAFMRRFDRKILIELPNTEEREQYISLMLSKIAVHNVNEDTVKSIASRSLGMSLAILSNVIETAKRMAFDKGTPLDGDILTEAFEVTKFGDKKDWDSESLERTARHEAGHAVISILGGNTPAYVTIEARGDFGGYMEHDEKEISQPSIGKKDILGRIRTSLGGRAAEIVYYGETEGLSTGACGDLEHATDHALNMIIHYGMDEKYGLAAIDRKTALASPEIMGRVNEILAEEMKNTVELIRENKDKIDILVGELLLKNRLTGEEIKKLIE